MCSQEGGCSAGEPPTGAVLPQEARCLLVVRHFSFLLVPLCEEDLKNQIPVLFKDKELMWLIRT